MTIDTFPLLIDYAAHLKMRNMSPKTIRRRRASLGALAAFVAPTPLTDATPELIEEWLGTFSSPWTKHSYRSDAASFFAWAVKRKLCAASPLDDVGSIRTPKHLPRPVPPQHLNMVLAAASASPSTWLRTALALAAFGGLRCAEIVALEPGDVSFEGRIIAVRSGKGDKDRMVPLHPRLATILGTHRGTGRFVPVSETYVTRLAAEHLRSLGLDYTLHNLRATFATELARSCNGNLVMVGAALGHESTDTTKGYVSVALAGGADMAAAVGRMFDQAA